MVTTSSTTMLAGSLCNPLMMLTNVTYYQLRGTIRSPVVAGLKSSGGFAGSLRFLYRGYVVACCRQGPIMLIQMPLVEQLRLALGLGHF